MTRPDRNPVPPMKEFPVPINRKGLPVQPLWLLSVLSVLSAAALACGLAWGTGVVTVPATAVQAVAGTVCLILLFYLFRVLRTMRWTPILLLFVSTGLLYTTGTLAAPAMLMALLCATGFSSLLLAVADKATLTRLAFIPLAAYGLSLALCRDPMLSLAALMPFPAAAALAFGTRASAEREDGPGRVGVICLTSLCLGVTTLGIAALLLSRRIGSLSPAHLGALLDNLRTELSLRLVTLTQQLAEQIPQLSALTKEQALNIINSAINLFPGTAVMLCNLCAALMQVILQGSLCAFGYADSVRGRVRLFRMSLMSSSGGEYDAEIYITLPDDYSGNSVGKEIEALCADMDCTVTAANVMSGMMSYVTGSGVSLTVYSEDMETLQPSIDQAVEIIKSFVLAGLNITMNQFNKLGKKKKIG